MDKILRRKDVAEATGLSRTTIWRLMQKGTFPQSVKLTENTMGWRQSEVEKWIESRPTEKIDMPNAHYLGAKKQ